MTVGELRERMTLSEEAGWVEYHSMIAEERKRSADEMKAQGRVRRTTSRR